MLSSSGVPRWIEIREAVRHRMVENKDLDQSTLSDVALASEFGVSRMTVRQALRDLVNEGLLVREPGRGTRVADQPRVIGRHAAFGHFADDIREQGHVASLKLISRADLSATAELAAKLEIVEGQPVEVVRRLRCADGQAVAVDDRYLPINISRSLTDEELVAEPLWRLIQRRFAIVADTAEVEIAAIAASEGLADLLGVSSGTPLLARHTRVRARDGRIIFCGTVVHHPERYPYRSIVPADVDTTTES
ncbi:MAG: yvoA3 [Marmoricola sp.]|jgi:GntR family transcriptional regulator|nr:yvoA3 [Marmoricola sp.]